MSQWLDHGFALSTTMQQMRFWFWCHMWVQTALVPKPDHHWHTTKLLSLSLRPFFPFSIFFCFFVLLFPCCCTLYCIEGPETATRGGWMEASIFYQNIRPLFQIHHQEHNQNTVMSTTLEKSGCSLVTQRDTANPTQSMEIKSELNYSNYDHNRVTKNDSAISENDVQRFRTTYPEKCSILTGTTPGPSWSSLEPKS